jgi:DNA-binding transcriptional regulator YiaG
LAALKNGYSMTKYAQLHKAASLNHSEAAEIFDVSVSTITRWKSGKTRAPKAVTELLKYLIKEGEL